MADHEPLEDTLTLPDGRSLAYTVWGDHTSARTSTAFYFHGFPGSRAEGLILHAAALRHHMRLIAVDRPGSGRSSPTPTTRTLLSWPHDILELADHLKIERFGVVGVSGGGPYALACWHDAVLRGRCAGVCVVSGLWPQYLTARCRSFYALRTHWTFKVAALWPRITKLMFDFGLGKAAQDACLRGDTRRLDKVIEMMVYMLPKADGEVIRENEGRARDAVRGTMSEAFRQGSWGAAIEATVLCRDWGFRLQDVVVQRGKVVVWHGGVDVNVPLEMATVSVPSLQGADFRVFEGEGHISLIVRRADEIVEVMQGMLLDEGKSE
ncbi:Alpha/Beta hydrolase protein [Microdochium trichocladiopsis]|uniref:Alpha/Beta hydrolase protein n=1 Tax=Microdochium trichocladiopsis TaxID=1682393 RepID=A0A9P9BXD0_9PEZI|nr:Alpha/Beta hydrolase protein [Microdochium trichocladiopsis]KAH7041475.1 Alpha/Beta hydrolase protein [Microdochium trichocladiopsis]